MTRYRTLARRFSRAARSAVARGFSLATIALVLFATTLSAQSIDADLSGLVTDGTGGAVAGALVRVVGVENDRVRTATADALGRYRVPAVPPGTYRLDVEAPGFGRASRDVRLAIGQAAVVDVELKVADVIHTVLVVSALPRASSGLGHVVDTAQIVGLPLNGRSLEQLALLEPGVFATNNRNSTAIYTHGTKVTINGAGPRSNAFLLDGTSTADFFNNGLGSAAGPVLGVEAVREFRVLTSGYSAAYGGVSGGTISVVTKSGSNTWRGSAFEFVRNDALDAREFFDTEKPDFTRHQFGAALGGPLVRGRTFVFGVGEGLQERLGLTGVTTVPSLDARAGRLPDSTIPGSTISVNPNIKPYLDLFPLPNGQDFGDGLAEYSFEAFRHARDGFAQLRVDHTINQKHNMFGRYTFDQASKTEPSRYPDLPVDSTSANHFLTVQANQVLGPALVNMVRVGFSRTEVGQTDSGPRTSASALAIIPGRPIPQLVIGGMPNYGTLTAPTTRATQKLLSLSNELTMSRGAHLLKLGGTLDRYRAVSDYQFYFGGRYSFPNIQRFLQGRPSVLLIALPDSDPVRDLAATGLATYLQDEIRLSPAVTFSAGLRWEFATVPTEARDRLVALPDLLRDRTVTVGELMKNHKGNIAPRIAATWRPAQGRTIVSASAGRFFDINTLPYVAQLLNNPPYFDQVTLTNPAFPAVFGADRLPSLSVPSDDWKTPEMLHYNVSLERELGGQTAVSVAFAGSRGYHLVRSGDINAPLPQTLADGSAFFPAGAPRRNPSFSTIALRKTDGRSWYQALLLGVRRRLEAGLQVQASYTWSKSTDTVQGTLPTEALGSVTQWLDPDRPDTDYGPSDFDRRHTLQVNAVWELPLFRGATGLAGRAFGGWTMSGILTALSGNPFTPGIQADYTRTLARVSVDRPDWNPAFTGGVIVGRPEMYFDPNAFQLPAAGTFGNVRRNALVGPGLATLDLAGIKELRITGPNGRVRVQFRVEVFNALNQVNLGIPQRLVFAGAAASEKPLATAGRITTTATSARQLQLAFKVLW